MKSFNQVGKLALGAFSIVIATLVSPVSQAHTVSHTAKDSKKEVKLCDFAPQNDLNIPAGLEMMGEGIDEATFNAVIDRVLKVYQPLVAQKGGKLQVTRKWSDGTVNASATRTGKVWNLNMYGGLARYKTMTADGFAMVMCHELGHHMGGFPRTKGLLGSSWASNEGQSDYFATMKCFRRVYGEDDNVAIVKPMDVPQLVTATCTKTWKSQKEIALCERSAMTSLVLANTLYTLGRSSATPREPANAPAFNTPTTASVSQTDNSHPLAQCRLDTYFSGALCGIAFTEDFAQDNAIGGACAEEKGDKFAFRPHCWYKPGSKR